MRNKTIEHLTKEKFLKNVFDGSVSYPRQVHR